MLVRCLARYGLISLNDDCVSPKEKAMKKRDRDRKESFKGKAEAKTEGEAEAKVLEDQMGEGVRAYQRVHYWFQKTSGNARNLNFRDLIQYKFHLKKCRIFIKFPDFSVNR